MAELQFGGIVKGGRFIPDNPVAWAVLPPRVEGHRVIVTMKRPFTKATRSQHGYYRSTILPMIAEWCGYDPRVKGELDEIHHALKVKFYGANEVRGLYIVPSHADADVEEMTGFIDWALRFAAEGGLHIPSPEDRLLA